MSSAIFARRRRNYRRFIIPAVVVVGAVIIFPWMFTVWMSAFDWKIGSTMARTNGTSGWVRAEATPYRTILRSSATSSFATSWAEAFQTTLQINGITYSDPDTWYPSDMTYLAYTRGALVYATAVGTPGAFQAQAWATSQMASRGWNADYKWRLGLGIAL